MSCGYRVIAETLASAQTNNVVVLTGLPSWYFITLGLNDLLPAAPAIAKGVAAIGAAIPFTAIVKRMLGPAAGKAQQRTCPPFAPSPV
jgi:hypothetical protein